MLYLHLKSGVLLRDGSCANQCVVRKIWHPGMSTAATNDCLSLTCLKKNIRPRVSFR